MAEPATTSPPAVGVAERDALLATKLHLPRPHPGFLPRRRLLDQLAAAAERELTLVCAPAGFGKTSLLADWARRSAGPVAWLSLEAGDNDPARFWRYLAAALDQVWQGVGGLVTALLRGPQPASLEAVVTALVNTLAVHSDQVALVLDDYHLMETPEIHDSLAFLLDRLPSQLRLLLASRADPPLPLARLRARGQLAELRERDLRFTPVETAQFLGEVMGLALPAGSQAALAARTEGWVAGLQLAGLSLQGHADPAGFVATFSASNRYVLDYLSEEVLARQPEPLVGFLLETSVLERLSGELCDAVTGRTDSQALLEAIERANLFLVPLDEVRGWWRYHHLFADLLQARLRQERPERIPGLHRAAAAWSEEHGLADQAVHHALAAGEVEGAARLIERHFDAVLRRAEDATLARWLAALPAELVRARPRLCLVEAYWALIDGRLEQAARLLEDAERAVATTAEEPYEPSVGRAASLLANIPATIALGRAALAELHGDAEQTSAFARQALAEVGEGESMVESQARGYLAVADWLRGQVVEAEQALGGLVAAQRAAGDRSMAMWPQYELGQVQQARGHLGAALRNFEQTLNIASDPGRALPPEGIAYAGMAEVLYERGELETALQHATDGVGLCRQLASALPLAIGLAVLARVRQAQGDRAGALQAIAEAGRGRPDSQVISLLDPVPVVAARLLLAHDQIAEAARWTIERGLEAEDEPSYVRERDQLVLVRVLLASGQAERALPLLGRLHALAAAQGRMGSVIEVRALQALALHAAGDLPGALAALAEALVLAAPEGWLRVFVDEDAPMAALLGKLVAPASGRASVTAQVPAAYLGRLLDAFERAGLPLLARPRRSGVAVAGLLVPLSGRELEVLQLLADGKPNQAIAEELVVTVDTVKSHVSHILDKLGAANRTQAVARARELGLLP
jgi:LuxR family transcriptional regulator, maltose regulon positive regulatory protein